MKRGELKLKNVHTFTVLSGESRKGGSSIASGGSMKKVCVWGGGGGGCEAVLCPLAQRAENVFTKFFKGVLANQYWKYSW